MSYAYSCLQLAYSYETRFQVFLALFYYVYVDLCHTSILPSFYIMSITIT